MLTRRILVEPPRGGLGARAAAPGGRGVLAKNPAERPGPPTCSGALLAARRAWATRGTCARRSPGAGARSGRRSLHPGSREGRLAAVSSPPYSSSLSVSSPSSLSSSSLHDEPSVPGEDPGKGARRAGPRKGDAPVAAGLRGAGHGLHGGGHRGRRDGGGGSRPAGRSRRSRAGAAGPAAEGMPTASVFARHGTRPPTPRRPRVATPTTPSTVQVTTTRTVSLPPRVSTAVDGREDPLPERPQGPRGSGDSPDDGDDPRD
ncbi:hypothetical protein [Streptosporangium vulgare]|uniref:hypothetical protein n=1 Tax=Streptosporangium vulgare TaxID=46190 RepID=UPI0031DC486F